ncbi:hypothetical protein [Pseudovibrio sp. Tun.PSC04-5.I4]|uniref:hypothetical protein n=1 Tax=Pseudovibrio sp. Tun.PSC04-5.I4 TaxID=1798213 RepID=UPI00088666FE|nr:hypothetical protein [Pseudovibrio sp. Tun.PSC04-5.I4]SDR33093.1 hypothetical protein SAMN04515695_4573 [Pseudovibrio sp. Tun.PSC04-5.I4]
MIEIALYIALGFFLASILALAALPFIWGRAVRLTRKAIEASNPISYARATMAKDALRAKHAIAVRQMEVRLQNMTEKMAENASARSLADAKVAELQEELSVVQLKSARDRKSMAQKATRFLRRRSPSDPIPFSAEDRITTDPIAEPDETASEAPEPTPVVAEQQQSAEIIELQQKAAAKKTRELDQELKEAPASAKPVAPVDTAGLEDMNNPLADLAAQISKQVSEMTAEADTKRKPTSPAEAAQLASQSFSKLKSRYGSLERERDKLKHDLKVEKAAQTQPAKRSLSNPNIKTPEHMKSLETNLDDAKKTIEQLTKQLEERAKSSSKIEDAVDLRNELKDLAAQITAKAISENPPLSDKYDEVLNDLSTLTGADAPVETPEPKTRRARASAKTAKPRTRKAAAAKTAGATSKADDTAVAPEDDKNLAERIADVRKTSNSHG